MNESSKQFIINTLSILEIAHLLNQNKHENMFTSIINDFGKQS